MSYQINENGDHSSEKLDGSCQCHCIIQCAIASIRPDREKKKVKTGQHFVTKPTTHSSGCRDCKDQTKQEKCTPVLRTGLRQCLLFRVGVWSVDSSYSSVYLT